MNESKVKNIPWLRMLLDGAVIVASIILALAFDALWEVSFTEYSGYQQEQAVLVNLEAEFSEGIEILDNFAESRAGRVAAAEELLAATQNPNAALPDDIAADLALVFVNYRTLNIPNGALNTYLSSGNPELISNIELRQLLASWPSLIDDNAEEEGAEIQLIRDELRPYLMQRIALGPILGAHPRGSYGEFADTELDVETVRQLLLDPKFKNLVTMRLAYIRFTQREITALSTSAQQILDLLEQETT